MDRECDPNKCKGCKAYVNQLNSQLSEVQRKGLCSNVGITQGLRNKFVFTAKSSLCDHIVGLFAGEKIKADKFIIEYTGKVVKSDSFKD